MYNSDLFVGIGPLKKRLRFGTKYILLLFVFCFVFFLFVFLVFLLLFFWGGLKKESVSVFETRPVCENTLCL